MSAEKIKLAAKYLLEGNVVAFPTETVWGLGANAYDHEACKKIYSIKNRPSDNPLILHVHSIDALDQIACINSDILDKLARWMPGPLTLILKKRDSRLYSCGLETIGVRIPQLDIARQLLETVNVPIAAPSANLSGKPSLTRYSDVLEVFGDKVEMVLEGPDAQFGIESTVIDMSKKNPVYLRPGIISFEALLQIFPNLEKWNKEGTLLSPGLKYRHYAPEATIEILSDMTKASSNSGSIGFDLSEKSIFSFKVKDNVEYAKELYAFFIECDRRGLKKVYCQTPKCGELHQAILDRLEKAAYR